MKRPAWASQIIRRLALGGARTHVVIKMNMNGEGARRSHYIFEHSMNTQKIMFKQYVSVDTTKRRERLSKKKKKHGKSGCAKCSSLRAWFSLPCLQHSKRDNVMEAKRQPHFHAQFLAQVVRALRARRPQAARVRTTSCPCRPPQDGTPVRCIVTIPRIQAVRSVAPTTNRIHGE